MQQSEVQYKGVRIYRVPAKPGTIGPVQFEALLVGRVVQGTLEEVKRRIDEVAEDLTKKIRNL
jgi:hypothetical protein